MSLLAELKQRARHLKAETFALYLVGRHPETPLYAKLFVAGIVAYAFSPIDLIPDFVPVLGYLDDLILIPMGIALAIRMVSPSVLTECRARAQEVMSPGKPVSHLAGAVIVVIWMALAGLFVVWAYNTSCRYTPRHSATSPIVTDMASIFRSSRRLVVARICESICRRGLFFLQFPERVFKYPVHEPRHRDLP